MDISFVKDPILELGLPFPENFEINNTYFRFGKNKKYSLIGNSMTVRGEVFAWATLFDFSGAFDKQTFYNYKKSKLPAHKFFSFNYEREVSEKKAETDSLKVFFEELPATGNHPYLEKKGIVPFVGLPYFPRESEGNLAIPMISIKTGEMTGIEYITKDGKKFRAKNSIAKFTVYPINHKPNQTVFLTEGISDAFHINQFTKSEVYSAFGITNLTDVIKYLSKKFQNKFFFIMADNPTSGQLKAISKNRGSTVTPYEYKKEYVSSFKENLNVFVLFPPDMGINTQTGDPICKDFGDFYQREPVSFKHFITEKPKEFEGIIPLGKIGRSIRLYSVNTQKEERILENSKMPMLLSIASENFWKMKFGVFNEKKIVSSLFDLCRGLSYDPYKIRRSGAWKDNGKLVINEGKGIIKGSFSDEYIYLPSDPFLYKSTKELGFETQRFLHGIRKNFFTHQQYEYTNDGFAILAWAILSIVSPVVNFRYLLGFYGARGLWKSQNYIKFIEPLQSLYRKRIRKLSPAATFPFFKKILRENGVTSVFLNEAQGTNYPESYFGFIRESVYEEESSGLGQLGRDGEEVITPNHFMAGFCYNFRPNYFQSADMSRLYEVSFFRKDNSVIFSDAFSYLKDFSLPKIGYELLCYFLTHYDSFEIHENEVLNGVQAKQYRLEGHELSLIASIVAFYKTLNVYDNSWFDRYFEFISEKMKHGEKLDDEISLVSALGNITVYHGSYRESRTLRETMQNVPSVSKEIIDAEDKKNLHFLKLFMDQYLIRFAQGNQSELCLAMPSSPQLLEALRKSGVIKELSGSLTRAVQNMFKSNKIVKIGNNKVYCMLVPLKFLKVKEESINYMFQNYKNFNRNV